MPMFRQYRKFEDYQQALQAWTNVCKNIVAKNAKVQPPPMPMPNQYAKTEQYQYAIQAWQNVFE